ncbi:MAG: Putative response regulator, partial [uncultured Friedmanniella sp.]
EQHPDPIHRGRHDPALFLRPADPGEHPARAGPQSGPGPAGGSRARGRNPGCRARGDGRRRHRPGHPGRRGCARRDGSVPSAQGRGLRLPAGAGPDRPPRRRLARHLVARGRGAGPPGGPDAAARGGSGAAPRLPCGLGRPRPGL